PALGLLCVIIFLCHPERSRGTPVPSLPRVCDTAPDRERPTRDLARRVRDLIFRDSPNARRVRQSRRVAHGDQQVIELGKFFLRAFHWLDTSWRSTSTSSRASLF